AAIEVSLEKHTWFADDQLRSELYWHTDHLLAISIKELTTVAAPKRRTSSRVGDQPLPSAARIRLDVNLLSSVSSGFLRIKRDPAAVRRKNSVIFARRSRDHSNSAIRFGDRHHQNVASGI